MDSSCNEIQVFHISTLCVDILLSEVIGSGVGGA